MKKFISTLIVLAVTSMAALPAAAQTRGRSCNNGSGASARYDSRFDNSRYRTSNYRNDTYRNQSYQNNNYNNDVYTNNAYGQNNVYGYSQNRSVWNQHRDKITTAGGAVGGAILGGLIGGRKGAVIGAITGGAGAAVYTYKIRDRYRRF